MKKLYFLALLPLLAVSCSNGESGGSSSGGGSSGGFFPDNPFSESNRISITDSITLLQDWKINITHGAALAHLHYEQIEKGTIAYFEADYTGEYNNYSECYNFSYEEGSLDPTKSNVDDEFMRVRYNGLGQGIEPTLRMLENYGGPNSYQVLDCYTNGYSFSYYGKYQTAEESGYTIETFNKNGMITFYNKGELAGSDLYLYSYSATYSLLS